MRKTGILNQGILNATGSLGHTDRIVVSDAGLPIPLGVMRIDLTVVRGLPRLLDVLKPVMAEIHVEKIILSKEIEKASPEFLAQILRAGGQDSDRVSSARPVQEGDARRQGDHSDGRVHAVRQRDAPVRGRLQLIARAGGAARSDGPPSMVRRRLRSAAPAAGRGARTRCFHLTVAAGSAGV